MESTYHLEIMKLEDYIKQPLREFSRGDNDCTAFAAGWANVILAGKKMPLIPIDKMTFGDVTRALREDGFAGTVAKKLADHGFKAVKIPKDEDIVVIECEKATFNETVGIYKNGTVVVRGHDGLFFEQEPIILKTFTAPK
jgi:hypothetical protein